MTFGKLLRCLSVGFLFGIFAIGLLPFLIIVNWIELFSLTEYEASPLYVLFSHVTGQRAVSGKKERDKDLETNKSEPETHEG